MKRYILFRLFAIQLAVIFVLLVAGLVAARLGVRSIFYAGAGLYLLLVPLIVLVVRRVREEG